jgi:hypothetical protein
MEIWHEYVDWRKKIMPALPEEEQLFATTMNSKEEVILMKSSVVKAAIACPSVETVIDAENEIEVQAKAIAPLWQKLAQVKEPIRVEVRSEYVPSPEKGGYLLRA